jgi:hypothetical protein
LADPFCFRHRAAWFNSAGLKYGKRLRLCWIYPGQVRFNRSSGFHPEFPSRILGRVVECGAPNQMNGRMHLLVTHLLDRSAQPERYLVTVSERLCGPIRFSQAGWKSEGVQLVSASLRRRRYELMALMGENDWIESDLGWWRLSLDRTRLALSCTSSGDQL